MPAASSRLRLGILLAYLESSYAPFREGRVRRCVDASVALV
jgi:hypothetical protein